MAFIRKYKPQSVVAIEYADCIFAAGVRLLKNIVLDMTICNLMMKLPSRSLGNVENTLNAVTLLFSVTQFGNTN